MCPLILATTTTTIVTIIIMEIIIINIIFIIVVFVVVYIKNFNNFSRTSFVYKSLRKDLRTAFFPNFFSPYFLLTYVFIQCSTYFYSSPIAKYIW